jgi:tetratricopeptide (TPR) repeat protein
MNSDSVADLIDSLWQGHIVEPGLLEELATGGAGRAGSARSIAADLVRRGVLTSFQAEACLAGRGHELAVGPYRLLELVGEGALGRVFRARHAATNRVVALKVFHPRWPADATQAHEFHREAEAAARLSHPHLVSVLDDGTSGGVHYLVMEYLAGIDLSLVLERDRGIGAVQACRYAQQVALALQHAYERRLVPCDVDPSDLIVTDQGASVKLLTACRGRLGPSARGLGEFDLGSLLEPGSEGWDEAAATRDAAALRADAQSALHGLGRVLESMLAGRLDRANDEDPAPGPDDEPATLVPADLAAIVQTMMAADPARRYETPADCAAALARYCSLNELAEAPPSLEAASISPDEPGEAKRTSRRRFSMAFAAMFFLGALAGSALTRLSTESHSASPAPPVVTPEPVAPPTSAASPSSVSHEVDARPQGPVDVPPPVAETPPDDPEYLALLEAGNAELKQDRIPAAIDRLSEAIRRRPDLAAAYTRRAEAYSNQKRNRDAVADCNTAIGLDAGDSVAYRLRGAALACLGDEGGAIADSTRAIELEPENAHAFNTRGVAHFSRGEFRSALEDLTAAVRIDATLAVAHGNLAWTLATASDPAIRNGPLATKHARRACELTNWNDPVQLKNLAAAHAECREFDRAIEFEQRALAQSPGLPGSVADQDRSRLSRYQAARSAQRGDRPVTVNRGASPAGPAASPAVPQATVIHRGPRRPPRPFPTFRGMPQARPAPFVPLYKSGNRPRSETGTESDLVSTKAQIRPIR